MTQISKLKLTKVKALLLCLFVAGLVLGCETESLKEIDKENQSLLEQTIEDVDDVNNENDDDDDGLSSRCSKKGYTWLTQSPNNNGNWKLQYQGTEARRVAGPSPSFYNVSNSRFEVVGSSCNRLRFRVDNSDPTTSGSSNPRSELREMRKLSNGNEKVAAWSYTSTKWIEVEFKVREMPSSGRVSVVQIHSGQDDISQISVDKLSNGKYKVELWVEGTNGTKKKTLYDNASTSTLFKVRMKIENNRVKARKLSTSSYGTSYTIKNSSRYRTNTCYFKAGAYLIGANSGKARVEFYKIKTSGVQNY